MAHSSDQSLDIEGLRAGIKRVYIGKDQCYAAYEEMLNATSTDFAPWYAIPADSKPWMRANIADIIVDRLRALDMSYPEADTSLFDEYRAQLHSE